METIPSFNSTSFPFPSHRPYLVNKPQTVRFQPGSAKKGTYGSDFGGGLVDANMIVLRKRIREMEVAERNCDPPSDWTEWEKGRYATYGSDVCEFVGLIQTLLLNTRPSFAVGFVVLAAMSVPTSAVLISGHLVEFARSVFPGLSLG